MLATCGRRCLLLPAILTLASGCRVIDQQRTIDDLHYKLRNQQMVIDGHARKINELSQERDGIAKTLADKQMLLQVYQEKAAASDQTRDQAALELQDIKKQLEELARREPESFQWNPFSGTLGVTAEVLFRPGKADLLPSGLDALKKVLPIFKDGKELIRVDGHTDADPIKYSKWQDNWELAGARARTVLMFLEKGGISHDRLFFAAYADTRPRADNKSPEGKRANRRVELVPLPAPAASTTPEEPKPR